ncbi:MAG: DEAD/DEAH box helicase [Sulfurimonas sp.]
MIEETSKPQKTYYDHISVGNRTKQIVYFVEQHDKLVHFELFLKDTIPLRTIVICKSKKTADSLGDYLKDQNINAIVIHGNHRASQIQEASNMFNSGENNLLITTSKIYENLELKNIQRVLNYDLPFEPASYFETLRAVDEIGESILFVNADDEKMLDTIELMMKYEIPQKEIDAFTHTTLPKSNETKKKKPRHKKAKKSKQETKKED